VNSIEPQPKTAAGCETVTVGIPMLGKVRIFNGRSLLKQDLSPFQTKFTTAGILLNIIKEAGRASLLLTSFDTASVEVFGIDDRIAAGRTRFFIDLQHGTFDASVSRSTTRRQPFGHQMSRGTIIRDISIGNLLLLHRAFIRITPAFVALFVYHIRHARVRQRFVRAHVLSRLFVKGNTVRFFFRFVLQAAAIIGRVQNDLTGKVFLIRSGGRGAGLQDASLLLTSAFGPVYERLDVVAFGTAEAFETRAVFPADGNLAAARRFFVFNPFALAPGAVGKGDSRAFIAANAGAIAAVNVVYRKRAFRAV